MSATVKMCFLRDLSYSILFFVQYMFTPIGSVEHHIGSKVKAENEERRRCNYDLQILWHTDVGTSPFASVPLIADVDGDGGLDIVAAPFTEAITVVEGDSGKTLKNTRWPLHNLDSTFHASPLQFDIDGDGLLDIVLVTSIGEIIFYSNSGELLKEFSYQLPPVYVRAYWHHQRVSVPFEEIGNFVSQDGGKDDVSVDVHVYATPVLIDINRDGQTEELVVPTTHVIVKEDYDLPPRDADKFVVGGIAIVNLTALYESKRSSLPVNILSQFSLELTQVLSEFPAFNLFSPTVINLDGDGGEMEVITALSTGNIHAFSPSSIHVSGQRKGFPLSHNTIHGQVTVTDVDSDGKLELIAVDTSGNVLCFQGDGSTLWSAEASGTSSPGSRIVDTNMDGILDVVVPTSEGDIYVFNGTNGQLLPKWPVKIGKRVAANILVTRFRPMKGPPDIVFVADDGSLHIIAGDLSCQTHISLEETSFVEVVSQDLVPLRDGLELLVSTKDGSLICLGSLRESPLETLIEDSPRKNAQFRAWPGSLKSPNDFSFTEKKPFLYISSVTRDQQEVTGSSFPIVFEIADLSTRKEQTYEVQVVYGRYILAKQVYHSTGQYELNIPVWPQPGKGHVTVFLINRHGQISSDTIVLRFNQLILQDIQWLVLAPFVAMVITLLVSHGFPAKDLLPVTLPSKKR